MSGVSTNTACKEILEMNKQLFTLWSDEKKEKISGMVLDTVSKIKNCPNREELKRLITAHVTGKDKLPFTASLSLISDWNFLLKQFLENAGYELRDTVLFDEVADGILERLGAGETELSRSLTYRAGTMSFVLRKFKLCFNKQGLMEKYLPQECVSGEVSIVKCKTKSWSSSMGAWHLQMFYYASSGCQTIVSNSRCAAVYALFRQWEKDAGVPSQMLTHGLELLSRLLPSISVMSCITGFKQLLLEWAGCNETRIKWVFSQFPFISIEAAAKLAAQRSWSPVGQPLVVVSAPTACPPQLVLDGSQQQQLVAVVNNGNYPGNFPVKSTYSTPASSPQCSSLQYFPVESTYSTPAVSPRSNSFQNFPVKSTPAGSPQCSSLQYFPVESTYSTPVSSPQINSLQSGSPNSLNSEVGVCNCRSCFSSSQISNSNCVGQVWSGQQHQKHDSSVVRGVLMYSPFSSPSPSPAVTTLDEFTPPPVSWGSLESCVHTSPEPVAIESCLAISPEGSTFRYNPYR